MAENVPKEGPLKYACNGYTNANKNKNEIKNNEDSKNENENKEDSKNEEKYVLPLNCYDFVEGYYDPKKNILCAHITGTDIRVPTEKEVEWILKHCRVGKI